MQRASQAVPEAAARQPLPARAGLLPSLKASPAAWLAALAIPLAYLFLYTPYGMDSTDFGYFYGYAWRVLQGQIPYRDFHYIKPALPLLWHAFWLGASPPGWEILAVKAGFLATLLLSSWLSALYLAKIFNLENLKLPLPLLASAGFVFSIHSFPHMPWHTADGVLFSSAALCLSTYGWPALSGAMAACAMLCKQSFLLLPLGIALLWLSSFRQPKKCLAFAAGCAAVLALFCAWIWRSGAWEPFRAMTTGQLDIREALDAGIWIYLRQNWLLPLLAFLPWLCLALLKRRTPRFLLPGWIYLALLLAWHLHMVFSSREWVGYGLSWPTFFLCLGAVCALFPRAFLLPAAAPALRGKPLGASVALCAILLAAWSTAISGGYKIPAMMATPSVFCFWLVHWRLGGAIRPLAWGTLACGLAMFWAAWQYPYVFPVRPLARADLVHDAGQIYPQASGVMVDKEMLEKLAELKALRAKYGPRYKTLPGFTLSYFLNGDKPVFPSDWLIDWEIHGEVDKLYKKLCDEDLTVFMERDQMDAVKADNYERAGYGVPQLVRKNWRVAEETPHFVVFRRPGDPRAGDAPPQAFPPGAEAP